MRAALLLVLGVVVGANRSPIGSTITYQIHSRNDLREWHQLLVKGMTSLKIDPQYVKPSGCQHQLYANHSDPRGCLLLSHNAVTPLINPAYNTTQQVLAFITDPANRAWFTAPQRFYIALCFKGHGSSGSACDNSTGARAWLSLVDDFFATANAAVASAGLNLEFILDGDGTPTGGPCLEQRWRPWNATYISGSDAPGAFTSNDPTKGWDRFAVLNEPVDQWAFAVNASYGKFPASPYAWQVWEPADQATILEDADEYIEKGIVHPLPAGMRFAINIDVAQFEVYAGSRTVAAWNERLPNTSTAVALGSGKPALLAVPPSAAQAALQGGDNTTSAARAQWYSVWATDGSLLFAASAYDAPYAPLQAVGAGELPVPSGVTVADALGPRATLLHTNGTAELLLVPAAPAPGPVTLLRYQVAAGTAEGALPLAAGSISVSVPGDAAAVVRAVAAAASCGGAGAGAGGAWCLLVVSSPSPPPPGEEQCLLQAHLVAPNGTALLAPVCLAAAAPAGFSDASAALAPAALGADPPLAAAVTYSANGTVFGATMCISGGAIKVNAAGDCVTATGAAGAAPQPLPFDVGAQVDVALSADGLASVLESHSFGWCPSTEARNKDALVKLCDQRPAHPASGGKYLGWAFAGRFADFTALLLSGGGASPCSDTVLHGCFGMGTHPAAVFAASPAATAAAPATAVGQPQPPLFGVLHAGTSSADKDPDGAGPPQPYEGLLLDGWPLLPAALQ